VNQELKLPVSIPSAKKPRVPDQVITWLIEEEETLKALLDEVISELEPPQQCSLPNSDAPYLNGPGSNLGAERESTALGLRLQLSQTRGATHVARGDAFRLRAEYELAVAEYTSALEIESDNVDALIRRGQCFGLQGLYERAIADFTAAVRINPRSELALHHRGRALAGQKQFGSGDHRFQ
jgi:Tetratricopeptide repeat.